MPHAQRRQIAGAARCAARALQDVMLPELDHSIHDIESLLEDVEQEDAIWMRRGAGA